MVGNAEVMTASVMSSGWPVIHQHLHRAFINWRRESANLREGDFTTMIAAYARVIE